MLFFSRTGRRIEKDCIVVEAGVSIAKVTTGKGGRSHNIGGKKRKKKRGSYEGRKKRSLGLGTDMSGVGVNFTQKKGFVKK